MINKKRQLWLVFVAMISVLLAGCSDPADELVGNWKLNFGLELGDARLTDVGVDLIVGFRSDSTYTITGFVSAAVTGDYPFTDNMRGKWDYRDGVLTMFDDKGSMIYQQYISWSYDRNTITLPFPPESPSYFDRMQ